MTDDRIIDAMAKVREDVRGRLGETLAAILAIAWEHRSEGFSFDSVPGLDEQVNALLRAFSDNNLRNAEKRAETLLLTLGLHELYDESVAYAERETDGEDSLWRLDLHASHLKDLLAGWIAVAAANGWTKARMTREFWTWAANPGASPEWRKAGLPTPGWGSGYSRDISEGVSIIGQDIIATAAAYAERSYAESNGAAYYVRHRASGFHCPLCDSLCEQKIPISRLILQTHPRCVCRNEYFTADGKPIQMPHGSED